MGVDKGHVTKLGTWFSYGNERLGQGRENARQYLKEHADVRADLEGKLRKDLGIGGAIPAASVVEEALAVVNGTEKSRR
jgi:recombination protein RecA